MATITEETDDPQNDSFVDEPSEDEEEGQDFSNPEEEDDLPDESEENQPPPDEDPVAKILRQLKSSGAAIKRVSQLQTPKTTQELSFDTAVKSEPSFTIKPATTKLPSIKNEKNLSIETINQQPHCNTCNEDFEDRNELYCHLIQHVRMPYIVIQKLDSDDEEEEDDRDNWSDEEDDQETEIPVKNAPKPTTKQQQPGIDILKNLGVAISIKKPENTSANNTKAFNVANKNATITKLMESSIEKSIVPETAAIEKINTSGALKLTIKQTVGKDNFHVVNNEIKKEPSAVASTNPSINKTSTKITKGSMISGECDIDDNKDGLLERCRIKEEPSDVPQPSTPIVQNLPPAIPTQAKVKDEVRSRPGSPADNHYTPNQPVPSQPTVIQPIIPKPMVIPKKEPDSSVAIIEINGDDSDNDDIMFVDSTPPIDKKPIIGLPSVSGAQITEIPTSMPNFSSSNLMNSSMSYPPTSRSMSNTSNMSNLSPQISTEKQHNFNWNQPNKGMDTIISDKNTDAIFESLLSNHRKDSNTDLGGASEYISLDTLGPKHVCEVCQTRFSDFKMLENHKRATGHTSQIVTAGAASSSTALMPSYGQSGNFLAMNSLFPVKQLAETVGKLANVNSTSGFSHQQNIMVNIQSFPGQNFMPGNQPPNAYGNMTPQMPGTYPNTGYRIPDPNQPYQYPQTPHAPTFPGMNSYGQYPQAPYGQQPSTPYPPPYPPHTGQYGVTQPPYGQNQYGQPVSTQPGQMPPTSLPSTLPTLHDQSGQQSPNKIGGIRIQNSQSPVPGQKLVQAPGARLMAPGAVRGGPRMPRGGVPRGRGGGVRPGIRPGVRPGVQVQGQAIRGGKPGLIRTPIKRPAPSNGTPMTPTKKRLDMLLPDRHDNEDCHVVSMQHTGSGYPLIDSVKGSKEHVTLGSGITVTKTKVRPPSPLPASKDAGTVASILAQRGIKITAKVKSPSPPPINIPNLGSAISITHKKSSSFHIPEETENKSAKCDSCPMSYPTFSQLQEHTRMFHNTVSEMGLPVVDLSNQVNLRKLNNLGIYNFIPLANREQGGGCFGIPIVSVQNAMNGALNTSLQALGAGGLLSLGPVKPLPKC